MKMWVPMTRRWGSFGRREVKRPGLGSERREVEEVVRQKVVSVLESVRNGGRADQIESALGMLERVQGEDRSSGKEPTER
jgi:hypothetical protein